MQYQRHERFLIDADMLSNFFFILSRLYRCLRSVLALYTGQLGMEAAYMANISC